MVYSRKGGCFDDVFTKLSAWSLVEYEKVMLKLEQFRVLIQWTPDSQCKYIC